MTNTKKSNIIDISISFHFYSHCIISFSFLSVSLSVCLPLFLPATHTPPPLLFFYSLPLLRSVDHYPYSLQVTWDLSSTDQSLAGEVRRFHCQAEDAEHHTDASLVTAVEYRLVVVIDEDRSNVALQVQDILVSLFF